MSCFTDALVVSPLSDGKTWVILAPFGYDVGKEGSGNTIDVEIGFTTDFTSIPRVFWAFLPRWGKYGNAAVIHDWLYWKQDREREVADHIMFEAMGVLSVPAFQKYMIYISVRALGKIAWKRNQWDSEAGFNRVLDQTAIKAITESGRPGLLLRTWRHYRRQS